MINRAMKLIAGITLGAVLCVNTAPAAFAKTEMPAKAAITKILQTGEGTEIPGLVFTFEFTPSAEDNKANMSVPDIKDKTASFSAAGPAKTENGTVSVIKETESLFDGVTWPHAGLFTYIVKEKKSAGKDLTGQETVIYSEAEYKITAFVANGADGLYVAYVATEIIVTDGEDGEPAGGKVDVTPGGDPEVTGDYSKMTFTNQYIKSTGTGNPADFTLAVSKTVETAATVEYDIANREMFFDFLITVSKSGANSNAAQKYRAYVMDESGNVVTGTENFGTLGEDAKYGKFIEFTQGLEQQVSLKHGQWLSFTDLEVGASYTVTEKAAANFTPSVKQTVNGGIPVKENGAANTSLTVPKTSITEGADRADFTNTYATVTPVGVNLDDLPFLMLIGLEILLLTGFIAYVVRKRMLAAGRDEEEEEMQ